MKNKPEPNIGSAIAAMFFIGLIIYGVVLFLSNQYDNT